MDRQWTCLRIVCSVNGMLDSVRSLPFMQVLRGWRLQMMDVKGLRPLPSLPSSLSSRMSLSRPSLTPKSSLASSLSRISMGLYMPGALQ